MRRLCILYGTQTGTAEGVALRIARLAIKRGADDVRCLPADDVPVTSWLSLDCPVLFVCSNANQGEAPDTFRNTWRQLLQPPRVPNNNNTSDNNDDEEGGTPLQLTGLRYAVFGLGHAHYYKFNYMAKMLHNRLRQLQATPLLLRGLGAQSDAGGVDEVLQPWLMQLWRALGWLPPASSSLSPSTTATITTDDKEDTATWPAFPLYTVRMLPPSSLPSSPADAHDDTAPSSYDVTAPRNEGEAMFVCAVDDNVRLTPCDYFQTVHRVQLRVVVDAAATARRAVSYEVGDALGVYCPNAAERVEALLRLLGVAGDAVVCVTASAASHGLTAQPPRAFLARPMTLRYLLTHYYDLDACVSQEFFRMLAYHVPQPRTTDATATAEAEAAAEVRERLCELGDPLRYHDYLAYAHEEKRNAYDVLFDFARVRPPLDVLLSFLPVMRPRYYSLASSPLYDPLPALHLLVARLDWQTAMRRHRTGLCSSWLTDAPRGARVACFVWQGTMTMPPVPTPLLCIAAGTGIAPVRSLLRQCAALARQDAAAATPQHAEDTATTTAAATTAAATSWGDVPIYLVFGCRHCDKDYLCADEWRQLRESHTLRGLTVLPAFSRDTSSKVYVQHVLGAHAQRVGALLRPERHAVVYVCGSAKSMPKSVLDTLQDIVRVCVCDGDDADAHAVMRRMSLEGRYQVDTWSA